MVILRGSQGKKKIKNGKKKKKKKDFDMNSIASFPSAKTKEYNSQQDINYSSCLKFHIIADLDLQKKHIESPGHIEKMQQFKNFKTCYTKEVSLTYFSTGVDGKSEGDWDGSTKEKNILYVFFA